MLTCDYERTRPQASPLERELYAQSLTTWLTVFRAAPHLPCSECQLLRGGDASCPWPELAELAGTTGDWDAGPVTTI